MSNVTSIQDQILDFNNDYQVQSLRVKYNRQSFFEMLAKGRCETVHSAFLAWLLQGDDLNLQGGNAPIVSFLGILVRRDSMQNNLIPNVLKKAIITRSIKINKVSAKCEYPVKKLAAKKYDITKEAEINKIATKSRDRIDILIDCDIDEIEHYKKLQIIIENKVLSTEGLAKKNSATDYGEYDNSDQTTRYYIGAKVDDGCTYQIFVYLTPLASLDLDDYISLSDIQKCGKDTEYIQINYQDIADRVIKPLLLSDDISSRAHMLLDEYIETLTIPSLSEEDNIDVHDIKKMLVMASKEEDRAQLIEFLNNYKNLIVKSILIANPSVEIESGDNCEGMIKTYLNQLSDDVKAKLEETLGGKIHSVGKYIKIKCKSKGCHSLSWDSFFNNEYVYDLALLYDFYQQNYRLIVAALKILVESHYASIDLTLWQDLYEGLTTNVDHTKYRVIIDDEFNSDKPLNKREVVKFVIEHIALSDDLINRLKWTVSSRMFLRFAKGESQDFDRSRYEGLQPANGRYHYRSLKDGTNYSLYVTNQWGILPLSENEPMELYPSGKGGNFGRFLDFFISHPEYNVNIVAEKQWLKVGSIN